MAERESPRSGPAWASEWDPHPLCWLGGILRNRYGHSLSFQYTGDDGLALAVGEHGPEVVLAARPDHPNNVHDVRGLADGRVFGCLVWISLSRLRRNSDATAFVLPDGAELRIRSVRGNVYVLRSPDGYLVRANRAVSDLPGLAQIAKVLDWTARNPDRDLDDDPDYWRADPEAPFAALLGVLDELQRPETAADLLPRLIQAPQLERGAEDRLRQFKPQLRQALRNPDLVPEKAVRLAAGAALRDPAFGDSDPRALCAELWRKLYPDQPLP